nr:unnamed protein product [Callosobruchus chinensis]
MGIEGFEVPEIKNKIRALRSKYSQEKRKIRDYMKSGAGSEDIYVPSDKWFKEIDAIVLLVSSARISANSLHIFNIHIQFRIAARTIFPAMFKSAPINNKYLINM